MTRRWTIPVRHGTHDPVHGTSARVPGSIRRTSTIDALRPEGIDGALKLVGTARDLVTRPDGSAVDAGTASVTAWVDFFGGRHLVELEMEPDHDGKHLLLGVSVATGFRAAVMDAMPHLKPERSLSHLLLDDLPGAALVSGYALGLAGAKRPSVLKPDLCAGWQRGGTIWNEATASGYSPTPVGPVAPTLEDPGDPLGWHELPTLPVHAVRRRRRLDLVPGPDGVHILDVHFRDSHVDLDGFESVIHEYTVHGAVERDTHLITAMTATPRVLPWVECPQAAGSAGRLVGETIEQLRTHVRVEFVGVSTCTHLNDTLRSIEDVVALARIYDESLARRR